MNILRALAREEKKSLKLIEEAQRKLDTVRAAMAEDARDIVQFLDFLLLYLYDYPKRISDYRQRRKSNTP